MSNTGETNGMPSVTGSPSNNQAATTNIEVEQPTFMSKISKILMYLVMFSVISRMINGPGKATLPFKNLISDDAELNLYFYVSTGTVPMSREKLIKTHKPKLEIVGVKYTSNGNSSFLIENELNFQMKIDEKNIKNQNLYLYVDVQLADEKNNREILSQFTEYESPLFSHLNILKYSENFKETVKQQSMINDLEAGSMSNAGLENSTNIDGSSQDSSETLPNMYYKPEITMYLVSIEQEADVYAFEEMRVMGHPITVNYKNRMFVPPMCLSDFWTMMSDWKPVEKRGNFSIKLDLKFLTMFYYKYMKGIEMNSKMMEENLSVPASKDMFVELLKNNSFTYLAIMFTVNILHSVFSALGFASDVSYYKNLKQLDGVYTKHLFFHIFQMFVAILYVSIEGAHFIVKVELFIGLAIEIWKLKKIFYINFSSKFPFIFIKHRIEFKQQKSKDYETEAVNLMMKYLFGPVAVLYLSYRVYYFRQTLNISLFKFFIEYIFFMMNLFGFILLTPQIYLNYKLKSVEHMPFKALTFKFLNTIIDDLYAFAVKTPTLYRIFCFKDDVIFVIFIYQIIKYRKNKRRFDQEDDIGTNEVIEESKKVEENKQIESNEKKSS
jgi:hypothetical protein